MQDGPAVGGRGVDGGLPDGAALDADDAADRVGDRAGSWPRCGRRRRRRGRGRRAGRRCDRCSAARRAGRPRRRPGRRRRPRRRCAGTATAAGRWSTATFHGIRGCVVPGVAGEVDTRSAGRPRRACPAARRRCGRSVSVRSMVMGGDSLVGSVIGWCRGRRCRGATWESTWSRLGGALKGAPTSLGCASWRWRSSVRSRLGWTSARSTSARPSSGRWSPRSPSPRGRPVSVDAIVDLLWGDAAPAGRDRARSRRTSPACAACSSPTASAGRRRRVLVTVAPGLRARRAPDEASTPSASSGRSTTSTGGCSCSPSTGRPRSRRDELRERARPPSTRRSACGAVRRTPSSRTPPQAVAERARLEELRLVALEDRAVAGARARAARDRRRGAGGADRRAPAARAALGAAGARADPGRAAGRRAARCSARCGTVLDEELGLEPSAELRDLQTAVLRQDPALDVGGPAAAARHAVRPDAGAEPQRRRRAPGVRSPPGRWSAATPSSPRSPRPGTAPEPAPRRTPSSPASPGIGKSRLAAELVAAAARARAPGCCIGRCSQDDGAPPLWPWATVLRGPRQQPPRDAERRGRRRRSSGPASGSRGTVRDAARERAGAGRARRPALGRHRSLRVLRLLVETAQDGPAAGAATWRRQPRADRRAGRRRRGAGPPARHPPQPRPASRRTTWARCSPPSPTTGRPADQAGALRERTDGNPFFLVEYARLAGERGRPGPAPRRGAPARRRAGRAHPPAGAAARVDGRRAAHGGGDRAAVRRADPRAGHRHRRRRPARRRRAGRGRRAGARGRRRPLRLRPRPGPRHAGGRAERHPPGAGPRPGRGGPGGPAGARDRGAPALARRRTVVRRSGLAGGRRRGRAGPALLRPRAVRRAAPRRAGHDDRRPGRRAARALRRADAADRRLPLVGACGRS